MKWWGAFVVLAACGGNGDQPIDAAPGGDAAVVDAPAVAATIAPTALDFGALTVGTTSAVLTVTVTNTGGATIAAPAFTLAGANPGDFTVLQTSCATPLAVGGACTASLVAIPTGAGTRTATLNVAGPLSAALKVVGYEPSDVLVATPTIAHFDPTLSSQVFTVTNSGTSAHVISTVAASSPTSFAVTTTTCAGTTLAVGATCAFTVAFSPGAGTVTGTAVVTYDGPPLSVSLVGSDHASPSLSITPNLQDFGTGFYDHAVNQTFTLSNAGGATLSPVSLVLGGADASQWAIGSDSCSGQPLAGGGSCTLVLGFRPNSPGSRAATLTATGGAAVATATVLGECCGEDFSTITPTAKDFGAVPVATKSSTQQFTVTNVGGVPTPVPTVSLSGVNATAFTIESNTCTDALPPGGTCTIGVAFTPVTTGVLSASLVFVANGVTMAGLFGEGISGPGLVASSPVLAFGTLAVGTSAMQTVTLTDLAVTPTGTPQASLAGANAGDFAIAASTCTGPIDPNASCTITVTATPSAVGDRAAALVVTASPGGTSSIALRATGD